MYCGQCGTRSPGGNRDGRRRSQRALHAADFTDGVRSCHPVGSHGVGCPCEVTGRALSCTARRRDILRMTKSQLIQRITDGQSLLAVRDVELAVKVMLEHMTACLAAGGRIEIRGFGSFSLHFRPARAARNPRTGTPVVLLARYAPYFRPGKALRERVDRLPPEFFGDSGGE